VPPSSAAWAWAVRIVRRVSNTAATTAAIAATIHQKYAPTNPMSDRMPMNCQKIRPIV
jgi:hypothetical protein